MNQVILDHLDCGRGFFLLFNLVSYEFKYNRILKTGDYVHVKNLGNLDEKIFADTGEVLIKSVSNLLIFTNTIDNFIIIFKNGGIYDYHREPLMIKWRNRYQIEYISFKTDTSYLINMCDVENASETTFKHYENIFNIRLNREKLKNFTYLQSLRHERNYITYRDEEKKLNILVTSLKLDREILIRHIDSLRKNPLSYRLTF